MSTTPNADPRLQSLERWIAGLPGAPVERIAPASADASFRRYFRVFRAGGATQVAMDAPPEREGLDAWLRVARLLAGAGVHVPEVIAADADQGFVLAGDLGRKHYLEALAAGADPEPLYADAIDALIRMQGAGEAAAALPPYDRELLMREMELFPEWFLGRHLGLAPGPGERRAIAEAFDWLCAEALAQPVVLVHRDYHSRNLMLRSDGNPGVVDFQDAVRGPVSYDLVSLLKDCYIVWPRLRVLAWVDRYRERAAAAGIDVGPSRELFLQWFDRMGLQRHLKVLGIFARLWHRDGKPGYLGDLPRVLDYALEVSAAEPALAAFDDYLRRQVVPAFGAVARRAGSAR